MLTACGSTAFQIYVDGFFYRPCCRYSGSFKLMVLYNKSLQTLQVLSIEVVAAGLCACIFAARICHAKIAASHYMILAGSIWVIYTADHLIDSIRSQSESILIKRTFHKKNFEILSILASCMIGLLFYLSVTRLAMDIWLYGLVLLFFSCLHLIFSQIKTFTNYPKEVVIAFIFCTGIWLLPFYLKKQSSLLIMVLVFIHLWLCVFGNLMVISIFERKDDRTQQQLSMVQTVGTKKSIRIVQAITVLMVVLTIGLAFFQYSIINMVLILILLIIGSWPLVLVVCYKTFFKKKRYLFYCDKVFWLYLIPALYWN